MPKSSKGEINELPFPSLEEIQEVTETFKNPSPKKPKEVSESKVQVYNQVLDLEGIRAEKAKRHLIDFTEQAWHIVEPKNPFVNNWHIGAICEALEALVKGEIKDLLINVPPRQSKSLICSVMFPSWAWIDRPELRWIFASYSAGLSSDHATKARSVMTSTWYQKHFGTSFELTSDAITEIKNNKTGYRLTTSVSGMATGRGGDLVVADDPHNVKEAHSDAKRDSVISWWDGSMSTRAEGDPKNFRRLVIMQRVHDKDLSGHLLRQGGYVHLNLPMEFISKKRCIVPEINFKDPRKQDKELLNPTRFSQEWIDKQKGTNVSGKNPNLNRKMSSWDYAGQFQQDPVPLEGGMAKRDWFQKSFYKDDPMDIYARASKVIISWDMSFKSEEEAKYDTSYVVGTVWAKIGVDLYLIHMFRAQIGFNDTLKAVYKLWRDFPKAQEKLVEDRANGVAVMNTLRKKVPGIISVDTNNDPKTVRFGSILWLIEAGNVRLPDPDMYPWVEEVLGEVCRFPKASTDDIVDSMTHALIRCQDTSINPDLVPIGVGDGRRFGHETDWAPEDAFTVGDYGVTKDWSVGRRYN